MNKAVTETNTTEATAVAKPDPSAQHKAKTEQEKLLMKAAAPRNVTRKLLGNDLKRAEYSRPDYRVIIREQGVTPDDVLQPSYWANVGELLKSGGHPFPIVEIIWADGSRYMRLLVVDCGPLWAKVKVLENVEFGAETADAASMAEGADIEDFEVVYKGPVNKWSVLRKKDQEYVLKGFEDKTRAHEEMLRFAKQVRK